MVSLYLKMELDAIFNFFAKYDRLKRIINVIAIFITDTSYFLLETRVQITSITKFDYNVLS